MATGLLEFISILSFSVQLFKQIFFDISFVEIKISGLSLHLVETDSSCKVFLFYKYVFLTLINASFYQEANFWNLRSFIILVFLSLSSIVFLAIDLLAVELSAAFHLRFKIPELRHSVEL